jgi:erythronate-4-phosphate dehydrogenase
MKIIADENMPLVREMFSPYGEVQTFSGREITSDHVKDADVLLVRSVTKVNDVLLKGSQVQFVGSATIGTDHVDQSYLQQRGISFAHAPGCNANAVVQYVLSVLFRLRPNWMEQTVGILGCGSVGGQLYRTLQQLGIHCRCYDPFLSEEKVPHLVSFDEVLRSDILCLHTPLTMDGPYPTFHLFDEEVLSNLAPNALLLNAGRGAVIDNLMLLQMLPQKSWQVALDVWEDEPDISLSLLDQVEIGTPHIAGYSYDGKVNGTTMIRDAFCAWSGQMIQATMLGHEKTKDLAVSSLSDAVLATFDVSQEDRRMRSALLAAGTNTSEAFDGLRKNCPKRLEFHHYRIQGILSSSLAQNYKFLGFEHG